MKKLAFAAVRSSVKHVVRAIVYTALGGSLTLIAVLVWVLQQRADLEVWHHAELDAEFTRHAEIETLDAYIQNEEVLFQQLDREVTAKINLAEQSPVCRYAKGSLSDPGRWDRDWNRTFVLEHDAPTCGVLLLHGMSDSPYSLSRMGLSLHDRGANIVGLRIPGHGTAPSGLVRTRWEDMAAAVRLGVAHLQQTAGDKPVYIIGYSNGAALAVEYALAAIDQEDLKQIQGMVLISPAIGVSPMAAFAVWQSRLGRILGLDKLSWNSIGPEYDPFKYGSFAINAGEQVHRLTSHIQDDMRRHATNGRLGSFPPVLAFQSIADATVSPPSLVTGLFEPLPEGDHELVIFDLNRFIAIDHLLRSDPLPAVTSMMSQPDRSFAITLITADQSDPRAVVSKRVNAASTDQDSSPLEMRWPDGVYSLSHVALPFAADDPLYGIEPNDLNPGIQQGRISLHGEKGVLVIGSGDMVRQRWNPFHRYMMDRILSFMQLAPAPNT